MSTEQNSGPPLPPPGYEAQERHPKPQPEPLPNPAAVEAEVRKQLRALMVKQLALRNEPFGDMPTRIAYRTEVVTAWARDLAKYQPGDIAAGFAGWYDQSDPSDKFIGSLKAIEHHIKQARQWRRVAERKQ